MLIQNNSTTRSYTIGNTSIAPTSQAVVLDEYYDDILAITDLQLIGNPPVNTGAMIRRTTQTLFNSDGTIYGVVDSNGSVTVTGRINPFTVAAGQTYTFNVKEGDYIELTGDATAVGSLVRTGGETTSIGYGVKTVGPWSGVQSFTLNTSTGSVAAKVGDAVLEAAQVASIVNDSSYIGLSRKAVVPVLPFCHLSDGTYLCTDGPNGDSARKLFSYDGDITQAPAGGTVAVLNTWNFSISSGVNCPKSADGTINMGGSGTTIKFARQLRSGAILIGSAGATAAKLTSDNLTVAGNFTNNYMLWRASPTSPTKYALGNDLNGTNGRAVLHLGASDGLSNTMTANVRLLHSRSVCEAEVQDPRGSPYVYKLLVGEYNVNSSRTPGGANDAVRLWQSLDDGLTFTKLLEFNTNGTNVISHIHSVIQDPYTRLIYILTGDLDAPAATISQNAVIVWDGVSAPPSANSTLAQIAVTPGWGCIYGTELCRMGDLVFGEHGVFGLPDCDNEEAVTWNDAYRAVSFDRRLAWQAVGNSFERQGDIPPLIGVTLRRERRRGIIATASSANIRCRSHRILPKTVVYVVSTKTLPANLSAVTPYYVNVIDGDNIGLATTPGGANIVLADAGTGNLSIILDKDAKGGYVYASLRTQGSNTVNEPYHHYWTSSNGFDWHFVAKTKNYNVGQTSSIRNFWQDKVGNVVGAATYAEGMDFTSGVAQSASAVILSPYRSVFRPAMATYD